MLCMGSLLLGIQRAQPEAMGRPLVSRRHGFEKREKRYMANNHVVYDVNGAKIQCLKKICICESSDITFISFTRF